MLAAIMILACLRWQLKCNKSKMSLEHLVALAVASNNSNSTTAAAFTSTLPTTN
jgi:hypothetical protein